MDQGYIPLSITLRRGMKRSPSRAVRNLMVAFGEQTLTIDLTELVEQRAKRLQRFRKA